MTFTYSSSSIATDLAKVRLTIGDTDSNSPLLTDEEINYFLGEKDDIVLAACDCVRAIIAKLARDVDRSNLGMSASRSQKQQHYQDLLGRLEAQAMSAGGELFVGGTSLAEKESLEEDDDFEGSAFSRDRDDNP